MTFPTPAPSTASPFADLTERQRDVLHLVMDGLTNRETAARLSLSTNTVNTFVRLVYRKLGVSSRAQAVACGYRNGLQGANHVV